MRRSMLWVIGYLALVALLACGSVIRDTRHKNATPSPTHANQADGPAAREGGISRNMFSGDLPVAEACAEMLPKFSQNPSEFMLRRCEVFYTQYASAEQKHQLQCIAQTSIEACRGLRFQAERNASPDAGEGLNAKQGEGNVGKGKRPREIKVIPSTMVDLDCQPNPDPLSYGVFCPGSFIGAKGLEIGSGGLGSPGGLGSMGSGGLGSRGSVLDRAGYVVDEPIILGALDRSLIDEVVERHRKAIRYCYQRELTKSSNLKGRVVVKFVVAEDGSVSQQSLLSSTMNNAFVESCVVGRFARMQFAKPKGGSTAVIHYPFVFSVDSP